MSSKYCSRTTGDEVAKDTIEALGKDFKDLVCLITGGTTGIGKETARVLASHNAHVIITCRTDDKGKAAVADLQESTGNKNIQYIKLELSSLSSVKKFAEEFLALDLPLNMLILNAGIMAVPKFSATEDGFESQFAANHLGHFYLTKLLWDKIVGTPGSKVVSVSSEYYKLGKLNWDAFPPNEATYDAWSTYGVSKLCNLLFARELQKKFDALDEKEDKNKHYAFALHPGVVKTDLSRSMELNWFVQGAFNFYASLFFKNVHQGAATSIFCAVHPDAVKNPGGYFSDAHPTESNEDGANMEDAAKLWVECEKLIADKMAL
jgi:NAD(P)-dependent dehydrogenase (short-subunit alcohol dehydrogenase family)